MGLPGFSFNLNKVIFFHLKLGDEFDLVRGRRELTVKSRDTGAAVGVDQVGAGPIVHAGVGQTLVEVVVAPGPGVAGLAVALEESLLVDADARVADVLVLCALVDIQLAVLASPALLTDALVVADSLHTAAPVQAGAALALVDVLVALGSPEADRAALVAVEQVHTVLATPTVRHSLTVVNVDLALTAQVWLLSPHLPQLAADPVSSGPLQAGLGLPGCGRPQTPAGNM